MTDQKNEKAKILVIDDNRTVLFATREILENVGFEVITADRSIGASAIVIREEPDLVLMDLEMPLRGSAIIKIMRANSMLKDTKVVLYSSRPLEELQAAAEQCDADGFIQKSSGPEALVSDVRKYLERIQNRIKQPVV